MSQKFGIRYTKALIWSGGLITFTILIRNPLSPSDNIGDFKAEDTSKWNVTSSVNKLLENAMIEKGETELIRN